VTGVEPVRVAGVDCGTNSTRLLVAEPAPGGGLLTVERLATITRLGQGVDATGELAEAAMDRTVAVLARYREVMDGLGVGAVRMTATSAARDAANRDRFFDAAEQVIGVRPELLTGDQEGRLSFVGATSGLAPEDGPFLVIDIGGGSTELAYGGTDCAGTVSIDVGCVRLTEKFLLHDPPQPEELSTSISLSEVELDDAMRLLPGAADARTLIGLAGTVTTVAAVELGLAEYDRDRIHHFVLTRAAAEDVFRTLATEALADRIHNPGLEEARADVIVGGCCVLVAVLRSLGFDELLVSEADILDGLALSVLPDA
jgi:exopolyphosphatase/guanosine-5'-triphosphate,3'-diphosphate pyrophosphatase